MNENTDSSESELEARYRRLQAKVREYRQEAARCREIARRMAEARGGRAVLCGVYPDKNNPGNILAFACAPNLNEANLGDALRIMVREFWDGVSRNSNGAIPPASEALRDGPRGDRVTGTMADEDDDE